MMRGAYDRAVVCATGDPIKVVSVDECAHRGCTPERGGLRSERRVTQARMRRLYGCRARGEKKRDAGDPGVTRPSTVT